MWPMHSCEDANQEFLASHVTRVIPVPACLTWSRVNFFIQLHKHFGFVNPWKKFVPQV